VLAMIALAALGYFNYTYRLPRSTLMLSTIILLTILPIFTVAIRLEPQSTSNAVVVSDDRDIIRLLERTTDKRVLGYVHVPKPSESITETTIGQPETENTTNSEGNEKLGDFSRLDEILVEHNIGTVLLAFSSAEREELFKTLAICHAYGIDAQIHRDYADSVLTTATSDEVLVNIEIVPWDVQDRIVKRLFDISFAIVALIVLLPILLIISMVIKIDDGGPILYRQERTAQFGTTFSVYKFRTMTQGSEETDPSEDENWRVTRVGHLLRRTHLDEIPQLVLILTGRMSVVGPRATWTAEETHLRTSMDTWRKRWFVKPGLTGLAQIHGATSADPETKLRYDIEYIQRQSLWFDLEIVIRQIWQVLQDCATVLQAEDDSPEPEQTASTSDALVGQSSEHAEATTPTEQEEDQSDSSLAGDGGKPSGE
jgi:lipopolysaccharide/colanic/teichoic acid biosynthesis glycosyltransferase